MEQIIRHREEIEIDLNNCVKVIINRKRTFIAVFLISLAVGLAIIQFTPKLYKVSMLIQPPVIEELSEADKLKSAEDLKSLIVHNAFADALKEKLTAGLNAGELRFSAVIPDKTGFLEIAVERDRKNRESGVTLLKQLVEVISDSYIKSIEDRNNDIDAQIKLNEDAMTAVKEEAAKLQEQGEEIKGIEDRLWQETKAIYMTTAEILSKRREGFQNNPTTEDTSIISSVPVEKYLQDNSVYLNTINSQVDRLSIYKANLKIESNNLSRRISEIQAVIEKLKTDKASVSNAKIITQPSISPNPVGLNRKKILTYSISIGLFLGMIAVLLQEFRVNSLKKHA